MFGNTDSNGNYFGWEEVIGADTLGGFEFQQIRGGIVHMYCVIVDTTESKLSVRLNGKRAADAGWRVGKVRSRLARLIGSGTRTE